MSNVTLCFVSKNETDFLSVSVLQIIQELLTIWLFEAEKFEDFSIKCHEM